MVLSEIKEIERKMHTVDENVFNAQAALSKLGYMVNEMANKYCSSDKDGDCFVTIDKASLLSQTRIIGDYVREAEDNLTLVAREVSGNKKI